MSSYREAIRYVTAHITADTKPLIEIDPFVKFVAHVWQLPVRDVADDVALRQKNIKEGIVTCLSCSWRTNWHEAKMRMFNTGKCARCNGVLETP